MIDAKKYGFSLRWLVKFLLGGLFSTVIICFVVIGLLYVYYLLAPSFSDPGFFEENFVSLITSWKKVFIVITVVIFVNLFLSFLSRFVLKIQLNGDSLEITELTLGPNDFLNTKKRVVLYSKIQDVSVHQGLLDRIFGLATLKFGNATGRPINAKEKIYLMQRESVSIAGSSGVNTIIPGVLLADAEALKFFLSNKSQENPSLL